MKIQTGMGILLAVIGLGWATERVEGAEKCLRASSSASLRDPVASEADGGLYDIQNKDMPHGLTEGPLRGGYNGQVLRQPGRALHRRPWHCVEAYFKLNTLDLQNDQPNRDGIARGGSTGSSLSSTPTWCYDPPTSSR